MDDKIPSYSLKGNMKWNGKTMQYEPYPKISCKHQYDEIEPIECIICGNHKSKED